MITARSSIHPPRLRPVHNGRREPFDWFCEYTLPGMHLVAVRDGERCAMLHEGSQP